MTEKKITQRELREIANILAQAFPEDDRSNLKAHQALRERGPLLVPKLVNWIYRVLQEVETKNRNVN